MYANRADAGRQLAEAVAEELPSLTDPIVLGLPRGGVPGAAELARRLGATLDVLVVRKLGVPGAPEVAMGAIASVGGELAIVANEAMREQATAFAGPDAWENVLARERAELRRRVDLYRADRPPLVLSGRSVLLVDDGVATGATMRAAAVVAQSLAPAQLIAAAPVVLPGARATVQASVDHLVCPWYPAAFLGVGQAYRDFAQTSDAEVRSLLTDDGPAGP